MALPLMVFDEVDGPFTDALGMIGLSHLGFSCCMEWGPGGGHPGGCNRTRGFQHRSIVGCSYLVLFSQCLPASLPPGTG